MKQFVFISPAAVTINLPHHWRVVLLGSWDKPARTLTLEIDVFRVGIEGECEYRRLFEVRRGIRLWK